MEIAIPYMVKLHKPALTISGDSSFIGTAYEQSVTTKYPLSTQNNFCEPRSVISGSAPTRSFFATYCLAPAHLIFGLLGPLCFILRISTYTFSAAHLAYNIFVHVP